MAIWRNEPRLSQDWPGDKIGEPTGKELRESGSLPIVRPNGPPVSMLPHHGCIHRGLMPVVHLKGLTLFAAQGKELTDARHLDLIIDCAGLVQAKKSFVSSRLARFNRLNDLIWPEVIRLDWPDMTAPTHIPLAFWSGLRSAISGNVAVACYGAHGRTGTCIAALMIADGMSAKEAIETVRRDHCSKAIETKDQETYLLKLGGSK